MMFSILIYLISVTYIEANNDSVHLHQKVEKLFFLNQSLNDWKTMISASIYANVRYLPGIIIWNEQSIISRSDVGKSFNGWPWKGPVEYRFHVRGTRNRGGLIVITRASVGSIGRLRSIRDRRYWNIMLRTMTIWTKTSPIMTRSSVFSYCSVTVSSISSAISFGILNWIISIFLEKWSPVARFYILGCHRSSRIC